MDDEKAILYPESFFSGLKEDSKEYIESKALCRKIEKDFNDSFNPEARISAKVRTKLLDYGVISTDSLTIDSEIPDYIKDQFCVRKDISFVDLLSDEEKEIIGNFRTLKGYPANWFDLVHHLNKEIDGLFLNKQPRMKTPKGEAALRYYFLTRKPEELGREFVEDTKLYNKHVKHYEELCQADPYDYYKNENRPESKYWLLVWDAMDYSEFSTFTSTKIKKERQFREELNLQPLDSVYWDLREWWTPDEFTELEVKLIKEADVKHIDPDKYGVETIGELLRQIQWDFLHAIIQKNNKTRQRLMDNRTFLIAFFLRNKHRRVYDYYLQRAKSILNKLERIRMSDDIEEFEYLDLKARLDGDLLFVCVFHDYIRGGERFLRIPRGKGRPKGEHIKQALDYAKRWIPFLKEFGIKDYLDRGVELLNALARKEVYSLRPIDQPTTIYKRGLRLGLKYKGSRVLQEELKRLTRK